MKYNLDRFIAQQYDRGIGVTPELQQMAEEERALRREIKRWDGSRTIRFTCWFSKKYWDIHDYKVKKGGDGTPSHFYIYKCWNCGKEFII